MALDTFKAQLKAKAKTLGVNLSQKRIDAIADRLHKKNPDITDVAEHDNLINDFHELQPLDEIAKTDDRLRTLEKPKPQPQDSPVDDSKPKDDDVSTLLKTMMDEIKSLKADKMQQTIKSKVADKLKDKGVPEKFYSRWTLPEKDEDVDGFVQDIETDWKDIKQQENNTSLASSTKPSSATGGGKPGEVDSDILNFAKKQNEKAVKS